MNTHNLFGMDATIGGFKQFANTWGGSMATGFVMGGIGAGITGGDIWQGAAVGCVVALANFSLHKAIEVFQIDSSLNKAGYRPGAKAIETAEYAKDMADNVGVLKGIKNASLADGSKTLQGTDLNVSVQSGNGDNTTDSGGNISLGRQAFITNRNLALAMGHEMIHRAHHLLGIYSAWKGLLSNTSEDSRKMFAFNASEGWAYRWTERMSCVDFFGNGQTSQWHFDNVRQNLNAFK